MRARVTVTRKIAFDAGHRVVSHDTKCTHFHGHRFLAEFTAEGSAELGQSQFGYGWNKIASWIDANWDHGLILWAHDPLRHKLAGVEVEQAIGLRDSIRQKLCLLDDNPTAENMARHLILRVCPKVLHNTKIEVVKVRLWQTPNLFAEAEL